MLRKLMEFLQEKKVFDKYLMYCKTEPMGGKVQEGQKVSDFLKRGVTPDMYIWYPFKWEKTPEGYKFWKNIHREWKSKLTELEQQL